MSARNHYRAARACSELTRSPFGRCVDLEKQGLISPCRPVPDASTPQQRSFEALIVNVLADVLSGRQLGAAFGVAGVFPATGYLRLRLHPVMANRVLWEMLPRYDSDYGGVRGVPGMRMERQDGRIVLRDLLSNARMLVNQPLDPQSMMHMLIPPEQPLWLDSGSSLHDSETNQRDYWAVEGKSWRSPAQAAGRDWLLSRMLRRPILVNRTCREHGWANTYTHGNDDLVIEWCCDDSPDTLVRLLWKSGLTMPPDDPLLRERELQHWEQRLTLGGTEVVLRRGYCSGRSPDLARRSTERTVWYR